MAVFSVRVIARQEGLVEMLSFRSFHNTDPPAVVDLWRSRRGQEGLLQPVSADLFEQLVFGKLYFDYRGLILACEDGRAVGFTHAGFGPDPQEARLSTDRGVVCLLLVRPECEEGRVASGLLDRAEAYLAQRGAKRIYGGGVRPLNPFYLGLYGGCELPGVLQSDRIAQEAFRTHGYEEIEQTVIFHRDLSGFTAPVDRQQLLLRRQMSVQAMIDAPSRTWWEACTSGDFDMTRFDVLPRGGGEVIGRAVFRNMDPTGATGLTRQAGLTELEVHQDHRRQGVATLLLGEAFASFARQGIMFVEAQSTQLNAAAVGLLGKLGFQEMPTAACSASRQERDERSGMRDEG